jgi:hypothetical protein
MHDNAVTWLLIPVLVGRDAVDTVVDSSADKRQTILAVL